MQDHRFDFEVDGTPDEVWEAMAAQSRATVTTDAVTIEILHPGDADGNGLVRHCHFPVPRYLLTGGRARSWEWITEATRPVSWRYDAISKPLWSRSTGWTRLEPTGPRTTRVYFRETYHVHNPVTRLLFERAVHRFISKDNDRLIESALRRSLQRRRTAAGGSA